MYFPSIFHSIENYFEFIKSGNFFPSEKISDASGGSQTKALSRHLDYTISQQVSLFFKRKKGRESRSINTKNIGCMAKNLADASFSGLLSSFLGLLCGTRGSNEESGLPHDQLLHLSNSQHHQLLACDLSPWNISSRPRFCFTSSVPRKPARIWTTKWPFIMNKIKC